MVLHIRICDKLHQNLVVLCHIADKLYLCKIHRDVCFGGCLTGPGLFFTTITNLQYDIVLLNVICLELHDYNNSNKNVVPYFHT